MFSRCKKRSSQEETRTSGKRYLVRSDITQNSEPFVRKSDVTKRGSNVGVVVRERERERERERDSIVIDKEFIRRCVYYDVVLVAFGQHRK